MYIYYIVNRPTTSCIRAIVGYELIGHGELHCTENGTWNHEFPVCEPILCRNFSDGVKYGSVRLDREVAIYGAKAHFLCDHGYELIGKLVILLPHTAVSLPCAM